MRVRFVYKKEPRQFNYTPRYYDPEKEARERRRQELVGARPSDGEYVPGTIIRSKSTMRQEGYARRSKQKGKSIRLVLIIALLLIIGVWMYLS